MSFPNNFQNNPTEAISALEPPDEICAALGVGGTLILDMNEEIVDIQNSLDFKVFEGGDTTDGYHVYVSSNWDGPWTDMGLAMGTTEFDLADVSIETARYVKFVDDNNGNPSETNPGVDIDAVENLAAENAPYTPEKPDGPIIGVIDVYYTFSSLTSDPQGDQIYYMFNWGDGTYSEWLGPYPSDTTVTGSHSWPALGSYEVKVKAKDTNGAMSGWSEPFVITIIENQKPNKPTITGETNGKPNMYYTYNFVATDPDEDDLYYYIDWGDNNTEEWNGPYNSGEEFSIAHSWTEKGSYTIKAKVKDEHGAESDWATLEVNMPRNKIISNMLLYRFLGHFLFLGEILSRLTIPLR
jgi:hypothetical protein